MTDTVATHSASTHAPAIFSGCAILSHWGVIRAEGEDAAKFLQGQLTQDFALLGADQARLAAFCNAKGRMQASFIGLKWAPTEILLICSRDLLGATLKRLSMFVMRAKVKLSDASDAYALYGLSGDAVSDDAHGPWKTLQSGDGIAVNLYPAMGLARQVLITPALAPAPASLSLPLEVWQWLEVRSGIATLTQPLFEAFVPQMLNYESVGGVNFKKGCYPGQEVVARSQFRGTLKRRAHIFHSQAPLQAGDEVFSSQDPEQNAGLVVQACASPLGGWDAIVSLQISAMDAGTLHLSQVSGPPLEHLPLPYPLLADI